MIEWVLGKFDILLEWFCMGAGMAAGAYLVLWFLIA